MGEESVRTNTVLIADDDEGLRELIAFDFEAAGYSVIEAENGTEAIEKISREPVSAVVTDMSMPNGGGIVMLHGIRKLFPEGSRPPVVMITGLSELPIEDAFDLGLEALIEKPFGRRILVETVQRLTSEPCERWNWAKRAKKASPIHIQYPCSSIEEGLKNHFFQVGRGGIYLQIPELQPDPGTLVHFQVELEGQGTEPVLEGQGLVHWSRLGETASGPAGIGVEFTSLSASTLERVLAIQSASGFRAEAYIPKA